MWEKGDSVAWKKAKASFITTAQLIPLKMCLRWSQHRAPAFALSYTRIKLRPSPQENTCDGIVPSSARCGRDKALPLKINRPDLSTQQFYCIWKAARVTFTISTTARKMICCIGAPISKERRPSSVEALACVFSLALFCSRSFVRKDFKSLGAKVSCKPCLCFIFLISFLKP